MASVAEHPPPSLEQVLEGVKRSEGTPTDDFHYDAFWICSDHACLPNMNELDGAKAGASVFEIWAIAILAPSAL